MRPELLTVFPWEGGTQSPQSSLMHITFLSPYCCIISLFIVARQAAIRINTHYLQITTALTQTKKRGEFLPVYHEFHALHMILS